MKKYNNNNNNNNEKYNNGESGRKICSNIVVGRTVWRRTCVKYIVF